MDRVFPLADGRTLQLTARIGSGSHGEVWIAELASETGFRRKVAVKVLGPGYGRNQEAARRLRDEARLLGRIDHRNIVAVRDLVELPDGRGAVVMDVVPGADLHEILEALGDEPFPAPAALEVAVAILRALHAAWHTDDGEGGVLRVVHRDVKPANVRITPDGEVKVLDFGVARFAPELREARTGTGRWLGTERYMSPERIMLEGDTPEGDVYSVAATLAELLAGNAVGRTPVLPERHAAMVERALERVRDRLSEAPAPAVETLLGALRDALVAEPARRTPASVFADRLEKLGRAFPGEDLGRFARRVVSRLDQVTTRMPAEGAANPTFVPPPSSGGGTPAPRPPPTTVLRDRPPGPLSRAVAVVAALVVGSGTATGVIVAGIVVVATVALSVHLLRPAPVPVPVTVPISAPVASPVAAPVASPVARPDPHPDPVPVPAAIPSPSPPVAAPVPVAPPPEPVPVPAEPAPTANPPTPTTTTTPPPTLPAPPAPLDLAGAWSGRAAGRPFQLRLDQSGTTLRAEAVFLVGTSTRRETLTGTLAGTAVDLRSADGRVTFRGSFADGSLAGTYQLEGQKALAWSVTR